MAEVKNVQNNLHPEEEITPKQEEQMRKLANLILDRIEDDERNDVLKYTEE